MENIINFLTVLLYIFFHIIEITNEIKLVGEGKISSVGSLKIMGLFVTSFHM